MPFDDVFVISISTLSPSGSALVVLKMLPALEVEVMDLSEDRSQWISSVWSHFEDSEDLIGTNIYP